MFSRSDVERYLYVGDVVQPRGSDLVALDQSAGRVPGLGGRRGEGATL
jgi:hypothetical protein